VEPVAVIGMACQFPEGDGIDAFWSALCEGRPGVRTLSADELRASGIPQAVLDDPHYVRAKGVVDHATTFDYELFGYTAGEAGLIDPQQRKFLECAWAACEDAGYPPTSLPGTVGVFGSASLSTQLLLQLLSDPALFGSGDQFSYLINGDKDALAVRVANRLRLRGPAITVQTACSSSLVAVHLACQSLLSGESDLALAGGVSMTLPVLQGYVHREGGVHSSDGHCRPFDAAGTGFVPGNGAGIVLLKHLEAALRDGDNIHAVIKGSAVRNDGARAVGFTAPSVAGQAEAIRAALAGAGVAPDTIGYVEAHGTATPMGDPIEVAALHEALGGSGLRCALGSVKGNIGHLDAAAGVAGLIKACLMVERGLIPPTLHYERPNPELRLASTRFFIADRCLPWPEGSVPRRAAVNSLGIGGTNAHVIIEQQPPPRDTPRPPPYLLPLSSATAAGLDDLGRRTVAWLEPNGRPADVDRAAVTLALGRAPLSHRRVAVASDARTAARALATATTAAATEGVPEVVFMFPGGGAQYPGMGRALCARLADLRAVVDRCAGVQARAGAPDPRAFLNADADGAASSVREVLPALFILEYALAHQLLAWGIRPARLIGHSLGEYVGAALSGVFSLEDALELVNARAALLAELPPGAMSSVMLSAARLSPLLPPEVAIAALNAPDITVVSGPVEAMRRLGATLDAAGHEHRSVPIDVAAHHPMVDRVLDRFFRVAERVAFAPARIPIASNRLGTLVTDGAMSDPEYWVRHLREPVDFAAGLREAIADGRCVLLEVGPGHTLSTLAGLRKGPPALPTLLGQRQADRLPLEPLFEAVGALWCRGVNVDWAAFHAGERPRRVSLPTYPFRRLPLPVPAPPPAAGAAPPAERAAVVSRSPGADAPPPAAAPARAPIEHQLREILAPLAGVEPERIGPDDKIVALCASSLQLVRASHRIEDRFAVTIPFRWLIKQRGTTFAELVAEIARLRAARADEGPAPTTPAGASPAVTTHGHAARRSSAGELTPEQVRHIGALVEALAGRTPRSKGASQQHRAVWADSRSSAGFTPLWKEIIYPIVGARSRGSRFVDIDGNEYLDVAMGFGVHLFGHGPAFISDALRAHLDTGFHLGPQSRTAGPLAARLAAYVGCERVAFTNTGTEAVMTAIRLARTATGRRKVVSFSGSYHGFYDGTLGRDREGGSAAMPAAPGIMPGAVEDLIVLEYGAPESLETIRALGHQLAAVLVEPVQSRRPELQPATFLRELRALASDLGAALLFDEIVTGFRVHRHGAQGWFDVQADLTTYGKILGGGLPIGAIGGRRRFMDALDGGSWSFGDDSYPAVEQTFFAGTFCKHPLSMTAAGAVLAHLEASGPELQDALNRRTSAMVAEMNRRFEALDADLKVTSFGSLFRFGCARAEALTDLFHFHLLRRGVYTWEGRTCYLSTAHTDADVARLIDAAADSARALLEVGLVRRASPSPRVQGAGQSLIAEVPLSRGQRDLFTTIQLDPLASTAYHELLAFVAEGPLDVAALEAAFRALVDRHEALRTTFAASGEAQRIWREARAEVLVVDVSGLAWDERQTVAWAQALAAAPLDLERAPLVRMIVGRMAEDRHLLLLVLHHLVGDGHSSALLLREGAAMYGRLVARRAAPDAPSIPYRTYVERQEQGDGHQRAVAHWRQELADASGVLELPTDYPRPAARGWAGARIADRLAAPALAALRARAAREGATLFAVALGGYALLLHHLTGSDDLLIGVPAAGQLRHGEGSLVGYCLNLIPFRSNLDGNPSVSEFLARVSERLAGGWEHQVASYAAVASALRRRRRNGARSPLIETIFNLDLTPLEGLDLPGVSLAHLSVSAGAAKYDLVCNVTDASTELLIECDYASALFRRETVTGWAALYASLLTALGSGSVERLPELFMLLGDGAARGRSA
jgi:acyl transferase domain-containing protein/glutamate-1-semialdehyde aminotransferase